MFLKVTPCSFLGRYDSSKSKWESSEPMKTLRSRVGVAVVNKKLYAFGGYDGSTRLSTVECFDPQVCVCCLLIVLVKSVG